MRKFVVAVTAIFMASPVTLPAMAGSATLGTHRAVYDLSLSSASERSGISGMSGRMVYEFNGSVCEGFTVSFRFVSEFATGDDTRVTDQQTTTYEDVRSRTFRFVTRSFINQSLDREVRGSAKAGGGGLAVTLEQPEERALEIAPAMFPTEHMAELIRRANSGERFYESRIFDGSDDGDRSMITTTIVGARQGPASGDKEAAAAGEFADDAFWPVSMSYFEESASGDSLPVYSIAFKLYGNGVTRDLIMDYGDFVLEGRLAQLEMFEPALCSD